MCSLINKRTGVPPAWRRPKTRSTVGRSRYRVVLAEAKQTAHVATGSSQGSAIFQLASCVGNCRRLGIARPCAGLAGGVGVGASKRCGADRLAWHTRRGLACPRRGQPSWAVSGARVIVRRREPRPFRAARRTGEAMEQVPLPATRGGEEAIIALFVISNHFFLLYEMYQHVTDLCYVDSSILRYYDYTKSKRYRLYYRIETISVQKESYKI